MNNNLLKKYIKKIKNLGYSVPGNESGKKEIVRAINAKIVFLIKIKLIVFMLLIVGLKINLYSAISF